MCYRALSRFLDSITIDINEYRFHKTLRQAKLFIKRESLCTREKAEKKCQLPA